MRKFLILFILVIAFSGYGWLGEGCVCEQWVSEERADTMHVWEFPVIGISITADVSLIYMFIKMNADNDLYGVGLQNLFCDSAVVDSICWSFRTNDTDSDTLEFGYMTPSAFLGYNYTFTPIDTLIYNNGAWTNQTPTVTLNRSLRRKNQQSFVVIRVIDTSSEVRVGHMIFYYTAYHKRYGIPQ